MTNQVNAAVELTPSISDRIHNAMKEFIADHRFPAISFPGGLRKTRTNDGQKAKTVLIRSQQGGFEEGRSRRCGGRLQQRVAWIWVAIIHFDQQVNLDFFEELLMRQPIRISRDDELDQQIELSLLDVVYEHPPEKQSSHGTRVTYRFSADLSPL